MAAGWCKPTSTACKIPAPRWLADKLYSAEGRLQGPGVATCRAPPPSFRYSGVRFQASGCSRACQAPHPSRSRSSWTGRSRRWRHLQPRRARAAARAPPTGCSCARGAAARARAGHPAPSLGASATALCPAGQGCRFRVVNIPKSQISGNPESLRTHAHRSAREPMQWRFGACAGAECRLHVSLLAKLTSRCMALQGSLPLPADACCAQRCKPAWDEEGQGNGGWTMSFEEREAGAIT